MIYFASITSSLVIARSLNTQPIIPLAQPMPEMFLDVIKNETPKSYRLPANANLPRSRFLSKEKVLSRLSKNAILKSFKLIPYRDAMTELGEELVPDISPNRMVILMEIDFPNGVDAYNADYSSAIVTSIRDALTEQVIEYSITGKIRKQEGPKIINPIIRIKPKFTKPSFCSDHKNNMKLECQQSE